MKLHRRNFLKTLLAFPALSLGFKVPIVEGKAVSKTIVDTTNYQPAGEFQTELVASENIQVGQFVYINNQGKAALATNKNQAIRIVKAVKGEKVII